MCFIFENMQNDIYLIGEVGFEITLENVIEQVKATDQTKPLNVNIHSGGGSVYDGLAIYNYFKLLPQEINTISSGLVASIASIIYLAGNKETRKINNLDSFLIHLPSGMDFGNAENLEKTAKELRDIESKLSTIYENETDLTKEEALELMKNDEMLDVNFLKEKGFVSEIIEFKAVATFGNKPIDNSKNEKLKNKKMSELKYSKEEKGTIAKFLKSIGFGKSEAPANIIVKTAAQEDLDFYEREEGEPQVGDLATLNGDDATGEIVGANGVTYVFSETGGVLESIVEAEEEEDLEAKINALTEENARLTEELSNKVDKTELEAKQTELTNLQTKHDGLTNKLKGFSSEVVVDTKIANQKPVNKNKKTSLLDSARELNNKKTK